MGFTRISRLVGLATGAVLAGAVLAAGSGVLFPLAAAAAPPPGGQTTRESVAADGTQGTKASGPGASISDNGNVVVFGSKAPNLAPGTSPDPPHVYVRDRAANFVISLVGHSATVSGNGRFVAYIRGAGGPFEEVSVLDRETGVDLVVSRPPVGFADGKVYSPSISFDGRFIAFRSNASNLSSKSDSDKAVGLFVRDRQSGSLTQLTGPSKAADISGPVMSGDGRFVFYGHHPVTGCTDGSCPDYLVDWSVVRVELATAKADELLSGIPTGVSKDGRILVAEPTPEFLSGEEEDPTRVTDLQSGKVLLSLPKVDHPTIDAGGRYVAWTKGKELYRHDLQTDRTQRVDRGPAGVPGNGASAGPSVTTAGMVAFSSISSNLLGAGKDTNGQEDVFLHDPDVSAPDTTITTTKTLFATEKPVLAFVSTEPGTFECRISPSADWNECKSNEPLTIPPDVNDSVQGSRTLSVRAVDVVGNVDPKPPSKVIIIDTVPPETTIGGNPPTVTNVQRPVFVFSSSETGSTFTCTINTQPATTWPCTSGLAVKPTLPGGTYTFSVVAKDAAGNVDPSAATHTFTVDVTPPTVTIDQGSPAAGSTVTTKSPAFKFSSANGGKDFFCWFGAAAAEQCTSPDSPGVPLPEAINTFSVYVKDAAGNSSPMVTRSFTVDTTAPTAKITGGGPAPDTATNKVATAFTFTSSESGSTFQCQYLPKAPGWVDCVPGASHTWPEGENTFQVRAIDKVGLVGPAASRSFTVDTVAPDTTIQGPEGLTNQRRPTFTLRASESASFQCLVDAATSWTACGPIFSPTLADGLHTIRVRAVDAAGNVDPKPAVRMVIVDATASDTTITSGPSGRIGDPTPTYTFSATPTGGTFECAMLAERWEPCTSPWAPRPLADGPYTFKVRSVDPAGNPDPTPATRSIFVDTTPPDTTITGSTAPEPTKRTVTFTASESATFTCSLDGRDPAPCTSPWTVSGLTLGSHTVTVTAKDGVGLIDPTPATRTFTVEGDIRPPETTITSKPAAQTNDVRPDFTFTSSEPYSSFECRMDSAPFAKCSTPYAHSVDLAEGSHTFQVRAKDPAGNIDPTPATATFAIDLTPPTTTITKYPPAITTAGPVTFEFVSNDRTAHFECRLWGGPWSACTSPHTIDIQYETTYAFEVRAVDPAGNADPTPENYAVSCSGGCQPGTQASSAAGATSSRPDRSQPLRTDGCQGSGESSAASARRSAHRLRCGP